MKWSTFFALSTCFLIVLTATGTVCAQGGTIIVEKQTDPDGALDLFTFTGDASGSIQDGQQIVVSNIPPGPYTSTEIVPAGWNLIDITCDDSNSSGSVASFTATFNLEVGETVTCVFTNLQPLDYGDAPDSYGTLLASNGASHAIIQGHSLGPIIDAEPDGQPTPLADGDDINPVGAADDEDGVVLPPFVTPGATEVVIVDGGPSGGMLDAWIDYNGNGVFDHPSEHLWTGMSTPVIAGANPPLNFTVPVTAITGPTYARFRLSMQGSLLPTRSAPDGEVEDYLIDTVPVRLMSFTIE